MKGTLIAIQLCVTLLAIGLLMGLALAVMEVYGNRAFKLLASAIQKVLRGVPPVVLLMLGFFGLGVFFDLPPFWVAAVSLGIRSGAYQSQIFRGAIQSISTGQIMAARSIGMSRLKTIRYIVLPQALRRAIGGWTNEFATQIKDTSLAYTVGVFEVLRRGRYIIQYTYGNAMLIYGTVAIIYFVLVRLGTALLYYLEDKLWVPGFERRGK